MDLNNKLKGIPKIYYFNLDERLDRREYTENQYEKYGITNYVRYSMSRYQRSNFDEWKDKLILDETNISQRPNLHTIEWAIALTYLEFFRDWLENTEEDQILLMEDDYNISYIDYWHFDWEHLINNIPFDWDCVQLSFENNTMLPCFLHPILPDHTMGASLVNRRYIEKLVQILSVGERFDLTKRVGNYRRVQMSGHSSLKDDEWSNPNLTMDYIFGHCGNTYCLPLFVQSNQIGSFTDNIIRSEDYPSLHFVNRAMKVWWTKLRDKFSLEDFFMYGKNNDFYVTDKNITKIEDHY